MQRPQGEVRYDNTDRVVVITGGSGGIGMELCRAFAASGARVVNLDVNAPRETDLVGVAFRQCDTSRPADVAEAVEWVRQSLGGIDVLVNNAAIQPPDSYHPIDQIPKPLWDRMVAINFTGYTLVAQRVIPIMQAQGSGVIINMSSGQAHRTARDVGVYGPIKAANVMQARQWGVEYARDGIRVVSVSPGAIDTPMVRASLEAQGGEAELANRHPVGRIGQPREVASAVLWLSSAEASFITATDVEVDGGLGAFGAFADPYPMPQSSSSDSAQ